MTLSLKRAVLPALVAIAACLVAAPTVSAQEQRDPVIFVHGWNGATWNWGFMTADFAGVGYPSSHLNTWGYDTGQSNVTTANQFAGYVDEVLARTGASKVDVVTHSMGGLSTRYYLKNLGGTGKVDDWVSIGGPNHGTNAAWVCPQTSCKDMQPGSGFLTDLNAGDETPGGTNYGTFWSSCDEVIYPQTSTILDGAANHQVGGCIGHLTLLTAGEVSEGVRNFVA